MIQISRKNAALRLALPLFEDETKVPCRWVRKTSVAHHLQVAFAILFAIMPGINAQTKETAMGNQLFYRTVKVNGLTTYYREAGPKDAPTLLLLHGLPSVGSEL